MDRALARLRDPQGDALRELSRLVVLETTRTPLAEIAPPRWLASQLKTVLEATTRGDLLRSFVERRLEAGRSTIASEERPARTWWPEEIDEPTRRVLQQGWTPGKEMTYRILDQPAMRALVADVLTGVLTRFRRRMQRVDGKMLGGLGERAARKGRGLFGGVAGNLGGLASNVVGVVRDELEHGLDDLVKEFVASATRDVVMNIASYLSDPQHENAFAELRIGVLDVLLDTPVTELVAEFDKVQPLEIVDVVIAGLRATASDPDFVEQTTQRLETVMQEAGEGTLGDWLEEVELSDVWIETTTDLVTQRLQAVVSTPAFETWWKDLHAP